MCAVASGEYQKTSDFVPETPLFCNKKEPKKKKPRLSPLKTLLSPTEWTPAKKPGRGAPLSPTLFCNPVATLPPLGSQLTPQSPLTPPSYTLLPILLTPKNLLKNPMKCTLNPPNCTLPPPCPSPPQGKRSPATLWGTVTK